MTSGLKAPYVLARIFQIAVALILIFAAVLKAFDPEAFALQIAEYGIFPDLAGIGAWGFLLAEFTLGAFLILNLYSRLTNLATIALLALFIGVTFYAMQNGVMENCGCFGNLVHRPPTQVMLEDAVMLLAVSYSTFVLWNSDPIAIKPRVIIASIFVVLAMATAVFSRHLPVDNYVTELRPGVRPQPWLSQNLRVDLAEGNFMVFLVSMLADNFPDQARRISLISQNLPDQVLPVVLIVDPADELVKLTFQYGIACPAGWVDSKAARRLYRTLPRSFLIRDGRITRVWNGIAAMSDITPMLAAPATDQ